MSGGDGEVSDCSWAPWTVIFSLETVMKQEQFPSQVGVTQVEVAGVVPAPGSA